MFSHFYQNTVLKKPKIILDDQHSNFKWFDLVLVANDENFYPYMRNYAVWLLNKIGDTYD